MSSLRHGAATRPEGAPPLYRVGVISTQVPDISTFGLKSGLSERMYSPPRLVQAWL
jgi:hypothetical protein